MTDIVLVNQTTVLTDQQVQAVVPVLQTLFDRDFEPVWNTGLAFKVSAAAGNGLVPADVWPIYLQDHTNVPGAGGYHQDDTGTPQGFVFVADAMEYGEAWTVDLSHEFLEMASDPQTDTIIDLPNMPGYKVLREVGDAVEADALGYEIEGVLVTDWCTPAYFYQDNHVGDASLYDFKGHIHKQAPALLEGGYLGIQSPDGQWGQVTMFDEGGKQSRRSMRTNGRLNRMARR